MHEVVLSFGEQDRTVPLVQLSVEEKLVDSISTVSGRDMLVEGSMPTIFWVEQLIGILEYPNTWGIQ